MFQNITPVTKTIIIINVAVFLITNYLLPNLSPLLAGYFPFSPNFKIWQVITHMFMHGGFAHLLFNMLTLLSFGPVLERVLGSQKFLQFYLICGLGSFVLFNLWNYYQVQSLTQDLVAQGIPLTQIYEQASIAFQGNPNFKGIDNESAVRLFLQLRSPMVGASGAIFGVVAAFSLLFPNAEMFFMFIPFPVKAKYLLPIIIIVSLYLGIRQFSWDNIAHFAHLGGALVGILWILNWKKKHNQMIR